MFVCVLYQNSVNETFNHHFYNYLRWFHLRYISIAKEQFCNDFFICACLDINVYSLIQVSMRAKA